MVKVGSLAPEFDLACTPWPGDGRTRVRLSELRGRWLVLVFYPRDFSLICPTELLGLGGRIDEFHRQGADVLGVSTDPIETHEQWLSCPRSQGGVEGLGFALGSDEDGAVSQAYGVYVETQHACLRGLFVIDPNGVLQYQAIHNLSVGRRSTDVLRILAALQTGGLCASEWQEGDPNLDPVQVIRPGSVVSHYRIENVVGRGTFGAVFRAFDLTLRRSVALKVLRPGAPHSALEEARAAASLIHPNICTVFSVDHGEGVPLIAMEYLRGQALSRIMEREGPIPFERALDYGRQVAEGLAAAHARGIVHGDLKPENIIVTEDGTVKLVDFGLAQHREAQAFDPDATLDHMPVDAGSGRSDASGRTLRGTPSYMAPEQTLGAAPSPSTDTFAYGVLLYELATGKRAFAASNLGGLFREIRAVDPHRLASELPEPIACVVEMALQPSPERRRVRMEEIAERLAT